MIRRTHNGVILKYRLGVTRGHWKWHHSIDRIQFLINVRYLVSFVRYSELLVENREIFIATCI